MSTVLEFEFEELPLASIDGFDVGEVNGTAEIHYDRGGSWIILSVALDGSRRRPLTEEERILRRLQKMPAITHTFDRKSVDLSGHPLHTLVICALEGRWRDRVQTRIREQLELDREEELETAGYRR